ncbi:hypothetical protein FACS1894187_10650 [Synergistales bacterium]|nr:hypothetical protein FACS1894187_10650 [Synergistales bacterium]
MKHYGDITKIHGWNVAPVNVIIGGSPCQDLSVAGRQAGLSGERSGLFMEQLRIIKEMRCKDIERGRTGIHVRSRYMVWENVPGAFSSNRGEDFATILEETIKVICEKAPPPAVSIPKNGWPNAGCLSDMGGQWSLAWRVFDAQFWGVPQRRKRIALVADFGGLAAPEILFEREGVFRDSEPGRPARENPSDDAEGGAGDAIRAFCIQGNRVDRTDTVDCPAGAAGFNGWRSVTGTLEYAMEHAPCVQATMPPNVLHSVWPNIVGSLLARADASPCIDRGQPFVVSLRQNQTGEIRTTPVVAYDARGNGDGETVNTITGDHNNRVTDYTALIMAANGGYIVRRLTPLECERLQGFPDNWTNIGAWEDENGKLHKESTDTARYKAIGNSIALPPWEYVLQRLSICCGDDTTMASLFDGIGGFPLIWERLNGKGSCLWASEIEEFPIAVTKRRFDQ